MHLLVRDEIRTIGKRDFALAWNNLGKLLQTSRDCEPRVHIVTAGDYAQLPPVRQKTVFAVPTSENHIHLKVQVLNFREVLTELLS